jgi:hypothetical protein
MTTASNYALRLPASLKRELESVARSDGTSLNQFIVTAVAEKLATLRTSDFFAERAARANIGRALVIMNRPGGEAPRDDDKLVGS